MADKGFDYEVEPFVPQTVVRGYPPNEVLREHGYNWRIAMIGAVEFGSIPQLPPEMQEALDTTCGPSALRTLGYDEYTQAHQVIANAEAEIDQAGLADARYLAVVDAWSRCMDAVGYDLDAPSDSAALANTMDGGLDGERAIDLALADFACQRSVELLETRRAIRVELSAQWAEANPEALAAVREQDAAILDRAAGVLAG